MCDRELGREEDGKRQSWSSEEVIEPEAEIDGGQLGRAARQ